MCNAAKGVVFLDAIQAIGDMLEEARHQLLDLDQHEPDQLEVPELEVR